MLENLDFRDDFENASCSGKDDDLHTTTSVIVLEQLKLEDEVKCANSYLYILKFFFKKQKKISLK